MNLPPVATRFKTTASIQIAMKLAPKQITRFKQDGFLAIPRLIDDTTLRTLRDHYDRFIRGEIECGQDNRLLGGQIHQVMHPSKHQAYFRDNPAIAAARSVAAQLTGAPGGARIAFNYDMLIDKPAGTNKETPWHQDFAYAQMPVMPAGTPIPENAALQFWLALDDVDVANGCMQFILGCHVGPLLEHHVVGSGAVDERRLLKTDQVDSSRAVACPLHAGGCTVHHYGTPHYTGPNTTRDRNRRAYIFNLHWEQAETTGS